MNTLFQAKLDIVGLQEVRRTGFDSAIIGNYRFYWNGHKRMVKDEGRTAGVALAIKNIPHIVVESVEGISTRIMSADLRIAGMKVKLVTGYGPTEMEKVDSYKDSFWRDLKKACIKSKHQQLLLFGDFNATCSSIACRATNFHGQYVENQVNNNNGHRLVRFVAEHKLCVLNTYF